MKKRVICLLCLVAVLFVAIVGCKNLSKETEHTAKGTILNFNPQDFTVPTTQGTQVATTVKTPTAAPTTQIATTAQVTEANVNQAESVETTTGE